MKTLVEFFRAHAVTHVDCLFFDLWGRPRGKTVKVETLLASPLAFPQVALVQAITGDCLQELVDASDPDMALYPDEETARADPLPPGRGWVLCDLRTPEGGPVAWAPRAVLDRVLTAYAARGLIPIVAPEIEFYLRPDPSVEGAAPTPADPYGMDRSGPATAVLDRLLGACETAGLGTTLVLAEVGSGQFEVNLHHGEARSRAESVLLFKRLARQTAAASGWQACFMAKPLADAPGSAMHVHQSVIHADSGRNVFSEETGEASGAFLGFLAGQQGLAAALPLMAPYVNSWRRLVAHSAAPVNLEWGEDNRTCGLRVPRSAPEARRVENRLPGIDCNPYLALAASLAAGLRGMDEAQTPRPPLADSAYAATASLPPTPEAALSGMLGCDWLKEALGPAFVTRYAALRRHELAAFAREITPWEHRCLSSRV